ncbi:FG-GAP repeat domain-containing protein [Streptomyces zaomyceticus]|uniref:FG-GAP repeat domain-containing protein n=1 Tax=Streptomyces zaomyceticus TaxID=68286 RepID=UPI0033BC0863
MAHTGTTRRRLTAAVVVTLAVTAGTLAAGPAVAGPVTAATGAVAAPAQSADQDVVPFPVDAVVVNVGPTGFLSFQSGPTGVWRWTRFSDGVSTVLPEKPGWADRTDVLSRAENGVFRLSDMGTGADPVVIDTNPLGGGHTVAGFAGTDIVTKKANATGGTELHVIGLREGVLVDHTVTGLPADTVLTAFNMDSPGSAVIRYTGTVDGVKRNRAAVVDIAAHAVVEEYETPATSVTTTALSATHIAWVEVGEDSSTTKVAVTRRGTDETVRHDVGTTNSVAVELVGDWLTYRQFSQYSYGTWNARYALYARSLTTGETVKLLEHTTSSASGPDGTQLARGGTFEQDEGLYRIAPGAVGARPVVTLVASTGEPTALKLLSHGIPETIDFDRETAPVQLNWTLSRQSTRVRIDMVHTATGKTWKPNVSHLGGGVVGFKWDGMYAAGWNGVRSYKDGVPAPNGAYTWRLTAEPLDGIGPAVEKTGSFTVVRKAVPHDFNDNGTPDLLIREPSGSHLSLYNTSSPLGAWPVTPSVPLGTGWDIYDAFLSPGDVAGDGRADVLARDTKGVLWLHQGTGRAFAPRVRVGGGWQIYKQLTGGSDLTGDGRADLVATDTAGDLWLYKGTGSATAPFAPRVKTGHGWGIYNKIIATGNIGGGPAGDLVARDKDGVLWLYLGKGDGTFAARTRIGGGWNTYSDIVGFGDADRDGRPDLMALTAWDGVPYFYKGTGDWKAPFSARSEAYGYAHLGGTAF